MFLKHRLMNPISIGGLLIPPGITLLFFLYLFATKRNDIMPLYLRSFLFGIFPTLLLLLSIYIFTSQGFEMTTNLGYALIYSFFIVGFISELGKYLVLKMFILTDSVVTTPVSGILLTIMTSLGFSTFFSILFYINPIQIPFPYAFNMLLLLIGPANIGFGVLLGFFLGMVKFVDKRWLYNVVGILCAAFFSGLFNFCMVTRDFKLLSLFAFGSSIVSMVFIFRAIYYNPS